MTKISIMLPDYNGGELVRRSIESVLAQTYTDYVLYLIDNGSTKDNTREILHSYTGPRIVHVDVDVNNGTSSAYNAVLKKIDTPWVAVIHADDMWYPTKLEKQMAFLEQHPDYCILGTWYDYVDINDKGCLCTYVVELIHIIENSRAGNRQRAPESIVLRCLLLRLNGLRLVRRHRVGLVFVRRRLNRLRG